MRPAAVSTRTFSKRPHDPADNEDDTEMSGLTPPFKKTMSLLDHAQLCSSKVWPKSAHFNSKEKVSKDSVVQTTPHFTFHVIVTPDANIWSDVYPLKLPSDKAECSGVRPFATFPKMKQRRFQQRLQRLSCKKFQFASEATGDRMPTSPSYKDTTKHHRQAKKLLRTLKDLQRCDDVIFDLYCFTSPGLGMLSQSNTRKQRRNQLHQKFCEAHQYTFDASSDFRNRGMGSTTSQCHQQQSHSRLGVSSSPPWGSAQTLPQIPSHLSIESSRQTSDTNVATLACEHNVQFEPTDCVNALKSIMKDKLTAFPVTQVSIPLAAEENVSSEKGLVQYDPENGLSSQPSGKAWSPQSVEVIHEPNGFGVFENAHVQRADEPQETQINRNTVIFEAVSNCSQPHARKRVRRPTRTTLLQSLRQSQRESGSDSEDNNESHDDSDYTSDSDAPAETNAAIVRRERHTLLTRAHRSPSEVIPEQQSQWSAHNDQTSTYQSHTPQPVKKSDQSENDLFPHEISPSSWLSMDSNEDCLKSFSRSSWINSYAMPPDPPGEALTQSSNWQAKTLVHQDFQNYGECWLAHTEHLSPRGASFFFPNGALEHIRIKIIALFWATVRHYHVSITTVFTACEILNKLLIHYWNHEQDWINPRDANDVQLSTTPTVKTPTPLPDQNVPTAGEVATQDGESRWVIKLGILGVISFRIACKLEEKTDVLWKIPSWIDIVSPALGKTQMFCTHEYLAEHEARAFKLLSYNVPSSAVLSSLALFIKCCRYSLESAREYNNLGSYILGLTTFITKKDRLLHQSSPQKLAAAALVLAIKVLNNEIKDANWASRVAGAHVHNDPSFLETLASQYPRHEIYSDRLKASCDLSYAELEPTIQGLSYLLKTKPPEAYLLKYGFPDWGEHDWR